MKWLHNKISENIKIRSMVSAFERVIVDGYSFSGESHDFWEMLYVEKGKVCVSADDRVFELYENEIIFHKPMELHKFYVDKGTDAKIFIMSFDLDGDSVSVLKNLSVRLSHIQKSLISNLILRLKEDYKDNDSERSYLEYIDMYEGDSLVSQQIACAAELFLLSFIESNAEIEISNAPDALVFKEAVNIMKKQVCEGISVPQVANACNVSVSYLKKVFGKFAGLGVHKYFLKMKIKYASIMLKEGKSVTEVSDVLGFSSQNYFSTVFKRETGVSPLGYKNEKL